MTPVRIRLLGSPAFAGEDGDLPIASTRQMHLLAYLAVQGTWQRRDQLARLFWPDRPDSAARSNLRNLIHKTQAKAPFAPFESTEHALRLQASSDLDEFSSAIERGDWQAAVRSGAQDLLPGFEQDATEPFLNWLEGEREHMVARWKRAVQALLASEALPPDERQTLARAWAQRCPYDEDAVRALVAIAIEQGRAFAVQGIVRAFEHELQQQFGVPVSRGLRDIALAAGQSAASVRRGTSTGIPNDASPAPSPVLAGPLTSAKLGGHVGRRAELRELDALLADESVRLLTVTGPGGVGKSTLLAALHTQLAAAGHTEAKWINASTLSDAQEVMRATAAALGIEGLKGAASEVTLAQMLGDRRCLLLIDGAEQADLDVSLQVLLERCPQLRIVLAARRRLALDLEQIFVLDGFPLPDADELDMEVLAANDGVVCFAQGMRRAGSAVDLARDASAMAAIVHAVQGLPLALKLLANLTRLFELPQLLQTVQSALAGGGASDLPGLDELMPALSASFDGSWKSLSPLQQQALAGLAVFPGSFTSAAARAVTGAELPVLTSLVDQSLVLMSGKGRLSLHAAIRACVRARCPVQDRLQASYNAHFARQLGIVAEIAEQKTVQPFVQFLNAEWSNVEHAWALALQRCDFLSLRDLAESLLFQLNMIDTGFDVGAFYIRAELELRHAEKVPPDLRALLLAGAARALWFRLDHLQAQELSRRGLRAALAASHRPAMFSSLLLLTELNIEQGRLHEAEAIIRKVDRMSSTAGEQGMRKRFDYYRAKLSRSRGDPAAALRYFDLVIAERQRLQRHDAVLYAFMDKADTYQEAGDELQMIKTMEEALMACGPRASRNLQVQVLCSLIRAYGDQGYAGFAGREALTRSYLERANTVAANCVLHPFLKLLLQITNADFELHEGRLEAAAGRLIELLEVLKMGQALPLAESIFLESAKWFRAVGDGAAFTSVLRHLLASTTSNWIATSAQKMLLAWGEAGYSQPVAAPGQPAGSNAQVLDYTLQRLRDRLRELAAPAPGA